MTDTSDTNVTEQFTPDQLARMKFELLQSALIGLSSKAASHLAPTLTDAQKKNPALAAAIMAERLARAALHVFTTPPKAKEDKSEEKAANSW